jgi:hypothetical protein
MPRFPLGLHATRTGNLGRRPATRGAVQKKRELRFLAVPHASDPELQFAVEESSAGTGQLVARIVVRLSANAPVWTHVRSYPVFSKEPRVFFLHWIYEAFCRLKLAEAEYGKPNETTVQMAFRQGGCRDAKQLGRSLL